MPECGIPDRLGNYQTNRYKIWEWRVDHVNRRLTQSTGSRMTIYRPSSQARYFNRTNRWDVTRRNQPVDLRGTLCTVDVISETTVSIASELAMPLPELEERHKNFLDVLATWGQTWMWDSLKVVGDENWIHGAIRRGTLRAVTDGSYIRELHPEICSASFVLECAEGTGRIVGDFTITPSAQTRIEESCLDCWQSIWFFWLLMKLNLLSWVTSAFILIALELLERLQPYQQRGYHVEANMPIY